MQLFLHFFQFSTGFFLLLVLFYISSKLSEATPWCNGSTTGFGPVSLSSNLGGVAIFFAGAPFFWCGRHFFLRGRHFEEAPFGRGATFGDVFIRLIDFPPGKIFLNDQKNSNDLSRDPKTQCQKAHQKQCTASHFSHADNTERRTKQSQQYSYDKFTRCHYFFLTFYFSFFNAFI